MATVTLNPRFRHAADGDFYIKDNSSNNLKMAIFDVTFDDDEEYGGGITLDFSNYFAKLISVEDLDSSILRANNVFYLPRYSVTNNMDGTSRAYLADGTALFEIIPLLGGTEADSGDPSPSDNAIDNRTITVRVTGY